MSDALYQAEILALAKAGRAAARLDAPSVSARVDNPVCGDRVTIDLLLRDGRIVEVGAKVQGCALCQAAAALIVEEATGGDAEALAAAGEAVAGFLRGTVDEDALPWGRLASFAPVRDARSRHECVLLPFKAAAKALTTKKPVNS